MLKDLISKSRTYRRFYEDEPISMELMKELVNLARMSPSGGNMQPLKFFLTNSPEINNKILPTLIWAGYIDDWDCPKEGERPTGYMVIFGDTTIRQTGFEIDLGIASQSIMLGACEAGFGGCMFGSIRKNELNEVLNIDDKYKPLLVIALGKPKEEVIVDTIEGDGSFEYWRDEKQIHHTPKRKLEDLLF